MYRINSPKKINVTCKHCGAIHVDVPVEYDAQGGYADLETWPCGETECNVQLCSACPQFRCKICGATFCESHRVQFVDPELCGDCGPDQETTRLARILAEEWYSGQPWDTLTDQQRRDALVEAEAARKAGARW